MTDTNTPRGRMCSSSLPYTSHNACGGNGGGGDASSASCG